MINRYRRKPQEPDPGPSLTAVRYTPPLSRLDYEEFLEVARQADPHAEVSEVTFKTGGPVLVVRHEQIFDRHHPFQILYTVVEPGRWLTYSHKSGYLDDFTNEALEHWYEHVEVTKTGKMLTDADIDALADEAERGYDVNQMRDRRPEEGP